MGVEVTGNMEWLSWLIKKTHWLLEPQGLCLVLMILIVCYFGFSMRRPEK